MPAPEVTALTNGVRVASDPMPGVGWVAIDVFVECSPLDEAVRHAGAAHAIEHMVLGRGAGDPLARLRALDRVGSLNAATSADHTVYEADLLPERLEDVLDLLADALGDPDWRDWPIERDVLAEEAALARDDPADRADLLARRAVFGPGHPYGRPIEGTPASMEATTARVLAALHRRTYVGSRVVVAAAGEVDHDRLARAVERGLGTLSAGATGANGRTSWSPRPPRAPRTPCGRLLPTSTPCSPACGAAV